MYFTVKDLRRPRTGWAEVDEVTGNLLVRARLGWFRPPVAVVLLNGTKFGVGQCEQKQSDGAEGVLGDHVSESVAGKLAATARS
jgi:hypothetical protein